MDEPSLGASGGPLATVHDVAMLDLDGVVYVGDGPVPHAPEAIEKARADGLRIAFVTNNASRTPEKVAAKIEKTGVPADAAEVVTSAQAASRVLLERYGPGSPVVVLGAAGLHQALDAVGLRSVGVDDPDAVALVTGYGPDVVWRDVMRAATRVRAGLPWVASNTDETIPTAYGIAPGHGVMVTMLRDFTGVDPTVAGKPERPLLDETIARTSAERPLMVGDRLDTDIEGAVRLHIPALLVMTGVTGLAELASAPPGLRPTYVSADLRGLLVQHEAPDAEDGRWRAGSWTAHVEDGRLEVAGDGSGSLDDWWRVVAAASWNHLDETGAAVDTSGLRVPDADGVAGRLEP
ncbi:HAD-IIA family hydrolase [Nocardioides bigeumensis]|uniref:HAD-IIA family hydrolase n=1 Tax=Nocardioides bigeumensis TaxID=433657 RepID=UPI0031D07A2C